MLESKTSAQEITEIEEAKQKETRNTGFALMGTRDSGVARLSNGVVVKWHSKNTPWRQATDEISFRDNTVPPGTFLIDGKLYDAEELRKTLRWA